MAGNQLLSQAASLCPPPPAPHTHLKEWRPFLGHLEEEPHGEVSLIGTCPSGGMQPSLSNPAAIAGEQIPQSHSPLSWLPFVSIGLGLYSTVRRPSQCSKGLAPFALNLSQDESNESQRAAEPVDVAMQAIEQGGENGEPINRTWRRANAPA